MRFLFLFILLMCIPYLVRAADFDLRKLYGFHWSNVELPSTKEEKQSIIDFIYRKDSLLECEDWDSTSFENFLGYVHFVHINGDHLLDIIYSGEFCGEGALTYILVSKGNAYEVVFEDFGEVQNISVKDKFLKDFCFIDVGCCDNISTTVSNCVAYDSVNNLRFDCNSFLDFYSGTDLPNMLLKEPLSGTALVNRLRIRMSPKIESLPYDENHEIYGNISGELDKGSHGIVWAEEKDIEGRTWYFMQIKGTLGWVMAKYIKIETGKR